MLATRGNYQEVRNVYFEFRRLCRVHHRQGSGGINYTKHLTQEDSAFTKVKINNVRKWNIDDAIRLYDLLEKFKPDLRRHNIALPKRPAPMQSMLFMDKGQMFLRLTWTQYQKLRIELAQYIKSKSYDRGRSVWEISQGEFDGVYEFCTKFKILITETAKAHILSAKSAFSQSYSFERVDIDYMMKEGFVLRDYQTVGVDYMMRNERTLNADTMGLGKTVQSIITACAKPALPCLVICPKGLIYNWVDEIEKWTDKKALVVTKKNINKLHQFIAMGLADFVIVNYEGMKTYFTDKCEKKETKDGKKRLYVKPSALMDLFKCVIIDEAHNLKNEKADRFKYILQCIKDIRHRHLLTGTPLVNKVADIWALIRLLSREDDFGGRKKFFDTYKQEVKKQNFQNGSQKVVSENPNEGALAILNKSLRSVCMIRREKHEVAKDLPDKMINEVYLEIDNWAEYSEAFINLKQYIMKHQGNAAAENAMRAEILVRLNTLSRIAERGKIKAAKEYLDNIMLEGKVVVFTWYKETLQELKKYYPNMLMVSGDVKNDMEIGDNVHKFQTDDQYKIIGLTYQKGNTGFTLTASSNWVGLSLPWTPAMFDQAIDRVHRIGQENFVNATFLLGKDTVDKHKYGLIQKKRAMFVQAVDSTANNTPIQKELVDLMLGS